MKTAHKPVVKSVTTAAAAFLAVSDIQAPATALACTKPAGSHILVPTTSRVIVYSNEKATLSTPNTSESYIMIKYMGSVDKIKIQVTRSGPEIYIYDLSDSGVYEASPLSEDSGSYSVKVSESIQGNQYSQMSNQNVNANITGQFGPFLYPNQCVNSDTASAVVQTDASAAASATGQLGVVSNAYNYVINSATYSAAKASSVQSSYLPDVGMVLAQKKGICPDYAALMTVMLRSQDIPTKPVVGYTGNPYHAWISVYLEGQGWVGNIIYSDDNGWKLMNPMFASSSGQSQEIMQYIGNGSSYKAKYNY